MSGWFTRDSLVWWFGMGAALVTEFALVRDAVLVERYGVPEEALPYVHLAGFAVGVVSAWMKTSPRPHSQEGAAKITPSGK